ncbi:hypothetical protein ACN4EG_17375 [Alkalinema pantanalense CENA528]|uniref:hypothetical protein n=1 Tax=Alkalinema pantanalense TaxID=1620705 RepID=UPI003D6F04FB
MATTARLKLKQIVLGDDEIDVLQLPDGSYLFSLASMAKVLGIAKSHLLASLHSYLVNDDVERPLLQEVVVRVKGEENPKQLWAIAPEGLVVVLQGQVMQGNQKALSLMPHLVSVSINQYFDTALKELPEAGSTNDPVWQAYLESEQEREEVYRRLANS